jgi:NIMA (never in mitosis gene a)-related kinase 2
VLEPLTQLPEDSQPTPRRRPSVFETPRNATPKAVFPLFSAMKGVVFTASGETLATPTPSELAKFFVASPKAGFGFAQIFNDESDNSKPVLGTEGDDYDAQRGSKTPSPPSPRTVGPLRSPSKKPATIIKSTSVGSYDSAESSALSVQDKEKTASLTRIRRLSTIRPARSRPKLADANGSGIGKQTSLTATGKLSAGPPVNASSDVGAGRQQITRSASTPASPGGTPIYDLEDDDNLPSPFLRKVERITNTEGVKDSKNDLTATQVARKRPSVANTLRTRAVVNSATSYGKPNLPSSTTNVNTTKVVGPLTRRAGEEARKLLLRT